MLTGLQTEIDAHPELIGASKEVIINALNTDGTAQTESWAVRDDVLNMVDRLMAQWAGEE